ncbi:MAG TPA: exodeoxyribonuclease VII small subunit [Candidatus Paceibacterota bacterium]
MVKTTTKGEEINLRESLARLNGIVQWFEAQDEIDVEAGLEKVREGADLVKACKERLARIENEFEEIKKEVEAGGESNMAYAQVPAGLESDTSDTDDF